MSKKSGGGGGAGGSSLIGHLLGGGDLDHDGAQRPPGSGKDATAEDGGKGEALLAEAMQKNGGEIVDGGADGGEKASGGRNGPNSSHGATKRKVKPKPPPTRKAPAKMEAPVVTRQEASKFMDVHGSVMFLRGKLKEMLDLMGGPDEIRAKQQSRAQIDEMANFLASLIKGEDETAKRIEHGLSLTEASRHRPDLNLGDPMQSLKRFVDVRLAALRMFGTDGQNFLVDKWISSPVESFLSNAVLALLNYLDVLSGHSREILTLLEIVNCFFNLCNPVLNGRMETMVLEPDLVWMNMRAAVEVELKRLEGRPEDDKFIQKILMEWLDERDETLLLAMETNVEKRSDFGGHSLWGEKDHRGNRIMLCTPWFNYLDFVSDLIDYVYSKGYVFKPTSKPTREWDAEDVVVWVENLRLAIYSDSFRALGVNGVALLEMNEYDLLNSVGIEETTDRKKIVGGLMNLRTQAKYIQMKPNLREVREQRTIQVPGGAVGGEMMLVTDPEGKKRNVSIPEYNRDHTEKMSAGMEFKHTFSYQKTILNKWKLGKTSFGDVGMGGGVLKEGEARTAKTLWKGVTKKVKAMNMVDDRLSRVLRMSVDEVTLRLSAMEMNPTEAPQLADYVLVNSTCKRLELSFNNLGAKGCTTLCNALKENRRIDAVVMSSNKIGDKGAIAWAELIRISETIAELDLGDNGIHEDGGVALLSAAKVSPPLRDTENMVVEGTHVLSRLMLYGNQCGQETMQMYARAVRKNTSFECDLTGCPIGDEGMPHLAYILRKHWKQRRLDLRTMKLGHEGLRPIAVSLAERMFRTVTKLYLSNNSLGPEGAKHIALILEKNMALIEIDVSGCELLDEGVKIISGSMVENEGVEKIDFGDNGITDLGVATLASALGKKGKKTLQNPLMNPLSLKSICLTTNDISSDGLSVYSGILNLCKIVDLEMSTCMITDDGCKVLSPNLAKSIHLTLLDLSSNLITADGLWGMVEGLRKNNSLQILRLNDNRLLDGGGRGIATVLTGNKSLKEVNLCGNGIGPKGVIPIAKAVACRHVAMELWLSGNSFLQDYGAKITVQLLKEKNPIVTVYT